MVHPASRSCQGNEICDNTSSRTAPGDPMSGVAVAFPAAEASMAAALAGAALDGAVEGVEVAAGDAVVAVTAVDSTGATGATGATVVTVVVGRSMEMPSTRTSGALGTTSVEDVVAAVLRKNAAPVAAPSATKRRTSPKERGEWAIWAP